jgi:cardiolipin synthase
MLRPQGAGMAGKRKKSRRWLKIAGLIFIAIFVLIFFPRRVARPIKKQIHCDYGVSDVAFRESIGHLVNAPLLPGNKVTTLINGEQIFPAMLEAIRGAKKTVTMENFIFRSGKLSGEFVPLLIEKATNGVKVHVIMDSMGCSKLNQSELNSMQDAGVQFVKYNRPEWHKLLRVNHRDHRKVLVVDGVIGFTGGACMADEWMGNAESTKVWRDTHFRIDGPAVAQIQGVFMDNWILTQREVLHGAEYFPELQAADSTYARCYKTGPRDGVESARLVYLYSIAAARKNIRIAHSYFVPDNLTIDTLLAARARGVKIEVITPGTIDANVVRRASRARWDELMKAGVEFYEYQPALFHCKVMIVDDIWVTAGTVNFDNRSFHINDENTLEVWDRGFAATQIKVFEADKAKSRQVTPGEYKSRSWFIKAAEEVASFFRAWL